MLLGDSQGHPGEHDNPNTQVLIGQFSVAAGAGPNAGVFGTLLIQGENGDGSIFTDYLSFDNQLPAPGARLMVPRSPPVESSEPGQS